MTTRCAFCGADGGLTNEDVLPRWLLTALEHPSVIGTVVYRQSKGRPGDAPAVHSRRGKSLETKARVVCGTCNSTWMSQIEQSVGAFLPKLVKGRRVLLTRGRQEALARWSVKTILMLQHTHLRSHQVVVPPADYAAFFADKSPSALMRVMTARIEPPGQGSNVEATVQFLAENRDMAAIAGLMQQDGQPDPVDMHAYTATLQIGYWVSHLIRVGSPQFIAGLSPGPAIRRYALTIWPAHGQQDWPPPRKLAEIGGLIALARSLDAGVEVVPPDAGQGR
jgi:hypothetical protein